MKRKTTTLADTEHKRLATTSKKSAKESDLLPPQEVVISSDISRSTNFQKLSIFDQLNTLESVNGKATPGFSSHFSSPYIAFQNMSLNQLSKEKNFGPFCNSKLVSTGENKKFTCDATNAKSLVMANGSDNERNQSPKLTEINSKTLSKAKGVRTRVDRNEDDHEEGVENKKLKYHNENEIKDDKDNTQEKNLNSNKIDNQSMKRKSVERTETEPKKPRKMP